MEFQTKQNTRGPGFWKMNNSLLNCELYRKEIAKIISETMENFSDIPSKRMIWEIIKLKIKEISIAFSITKARKKKEKKSMLQQELNDIVEIMETNNRNTENLERKRTQIENELSTIYHEEVKGAQIRSRVKWFEHGEKTVDTFSEWKINIKATM